MKSLWIKRQMFLEDLVESNEKCDDANVNGGVEEADLPVETVKLWQRK